MAHIRQRKEGSFEIRESCRTEKGPRARVLGSFRGALTNRVLDLAQARATQSWNRNDLIAEARAKGIAWAESLAERDARRLLIDLRKNRTLDPRLVRLLMDELSQMKATRLPVELEDAVDWLGADVAERASALRGLLRLSDRIVQSRSRPLKQPPSAYPRLVARGSEAA
ncbi:MAG: hypothetical protein GY944_04435 [bacterium]|nr:hypothetical protein [bacterium]